MLVATVTGQHRMALHALFCLGSPFLLLGLKISCSLLQLVSVWAQAGMVRSVLVLELDVAFVCPPTVLSFAAA